MSKIWVDADACPKAIRDVILRAAERTSINTFLVANHALPVNRTANVSMLSVPSGADAADQLIIDRSDAGHLVITADLPLADAVLKKGTQVLTPRGESLTLDNIRARLNMRDFMDTMRASGEHSRGQKTLNERDVRTFANAFDRLVTRMHATQTR